MSRSKKEINPKTQVPNTGTWGTRAFLPGNRIRIAALGCRAVRRKINPKTQVPNTGTWGTRATRPGP
jgi:hypothetical protein